MTIKFGTSLQTGLDCMTQLCSTLQGSLGVIGCLGLGQDLLRALADELLGQEPPAPLGRRQLPVAVDLGKHRGKVDIALAFLGCRLPCVPISLNVGPLSEGDGLDTLELLLTIKGPYAALQTNAVVKNFCRHSHRNTTTAL